MSEKHLVCKGATVYCNRSMVNNNPGTAIPLTITSQTLVELNGGKVAATDKDNTPANMCFGNCNTGTVPPPPCVANVMWNKYFEGADVTEMALKFLTEESEGICMTFGGTIKIAWHGQISTPHPCEVDEVSPEIMAAILPVNPEKEEAIGLTELSSLTSHEEGKRNTRITDAYWVEEKTNRKIREVYPGKEVTLYVKTAGFVEGEEATVVFQADEDEEFEEGGKEYTVSGKVNEEDMVILENFCIKYKPR